MNSEQRMHINLSRHAYTVLLSDRDSFAPDSTIGGFANDIIEASIDDSLASISKAKEAEFARYRSALKISQYRINRPKDAELAKYDPEKISLTEEDEALINQLASGFAEGLVKKANGRPRDVTLKIRLRKRSSTIFTKGQ